MAYVLDQLADYYERTEQFVEAEATLRECLKLKKILFDESHTELALTLGNLGKICVKQLRFVEAEEFYGQALKIRYGWFR